MFGIKSRKRIEELETEVNNLKANWELSQELHGVDSYLKELTRNELIQEIIKIKQKNDKYLGDMKTIIMGMEDQSKLKKQISELEAEIESLKSRLTRKKK